MANNIISMPVSIYALGGLGEVGKNCYCIENEQSIIIIDAGVRFPGTEYPGIDYIIPDWVHLKNNRNKVKALFITHGHEDHIGGIPFLVQTINIPIIYAPRLAAALIKNRLEEQKILSRVNIVEYDENTEVRVDQFKVRFFRVTHSIPDSFGICIDTSEGRIVTTGDFKVDLTPIGPDFELAKLTKMGLEGVDLLLSDSTNAEIEGFTPSEKNVLSSIEEIFDNIMGRIIISTFSSNISRIQQICEVAVAHNRKIAIIGRSMEKAVEISRSFGYIKVPDSSIIQAEDIKLYKNNELLILCTGSQGEPMAALSRVANGEHKDLTIIPGDTVVFSSSAIPGNGLMIKRIVNTLTRAGADVITNSILSDIHSSGHASRQELRLVLKLVNPKYFMPAHGEYRMLRQHAEIAQTLGIPKENCFLLDNGDCLVLSKKKVTRGYPVEHGNIYMDGTDINGLVPTVMVDRRILTDDGMLAIAIGVDTKSNTLIVPPTLFTRGLIKQGSSEALERCRMLVEREVLDALKGKPSFADLKNKIKTVAGAFIYAQTRRHPMIIPLIMSKGE